MHGGVIFSPLQDNIIVLHFVALKERCLRRLHITVAHKGRVHYFNNWNRVQAELREWLHALSRWGFWSVR